MKSALVIYDTKFGNTEKLAKKLAEGIGEQEIMVDCFKVDNFDISKLNDYDLVAFGSPTHIFGISKPMKTMLKKLEQLNLKGKKAFAFDTKFKSRFAGSAGKSIEKKLKQLHMDIVKPYASGFVKGSGDSLEDGSEDMFKQIGSELAKS